MTTTMKVLFGLLVLALALLWLTGCGNRLAEVTLPDGATIRARTYNVTSESAVDTSNAATRLIAMRACVSDPELKNTEGCQKLLAEQTPSDHPGRAFNKNVPGYPLGRRYRYNREYFPGVWWY